MKCELSSYRIGHTILRYDLEGESKWGIADLDKKAEKNLRALIESKGDFETSWGSQKENYGAHLLQVDGIMTVTGYSGMDDLWEQADLIDDALWAIGEGSRDLTDEDLDNIRDMASDEYLDDSTSVQMNLTHPTYEEVMETLNVLIDQCNLANDQYFENLKEIVKEYLTFKDTEEAN